MGNCAVCGGRLRPGARQTSIGWVHAKCEEAAHFRALQAYGPPAQGHAYAPVPARSEISTVTWVGGIFAAMVVVVVLMLAGSSKSTKDSTAAAKVELQEHEDDPPKKAKTAAPTASSRARTAVELGARVAPTPLPAATPAPRPVLGGGAPAAPPAPVPAAPAGGGHLRCGDGSLSPSCMCGGSHRGCCSRHGGVAGCE